ncbi:MAG: peptidoglycan-associated lipoprotein [Acidobacteria bacterium RBG_16_68_9]|nr:MAG: peptidoglycan-associated lipoprotein [Acidobacteria bacterium RBG_16_68_9]
MGRWVAGLCLVAVVIALVGAGCSGKKKGLGPDGEGAARMGEESLGAGSLDQARAGTLRAPGAAGPLKDVQFDYDSFELDSYARETLKQDADWLREHRSARVEIEGHCDDRGTVEYNLALGAKRAAAVKSYLVSLGISADRLNTISYGEELPLCHEPEESCWRTNRRAHPVVVAE